MQVVARRPDTLIWPFPNIQKVPEISVRFGGLGFRAYGLACVGFRFKGSVFRGETAACCWGYILNLVPGPTSVKVLVLQAGSTVYITEYKLYDPCNPKPCKTP